MIITEKLTSTGVTAKIVTMPYSITPEGGLTIGLISGQISDDGQVIALTSTNSAEQPTLVVGVKRNLQSTNSVALYQGVAIKSTLTGTTIEPISETSEKGCIISENGNTAIGLDVMCLGNRGIRILLRKD